MGLEGGEGGAEAASERGGMGAAKRAHGGGPGRRSPGREEQGAGGPLAREDRNRHRSRRAAAADLPLDLGKKAEWDRWRILESAAPFATD